MATKREQEILALIKQDPLITQAQLAEKTGTTRSNIGSHISNLIKEGLIVGRGYVFPAENEVTVIGAVNLDVLGAAKAQVSTKGSTPGRVYSFIGGMGRNIATNLADLGVKTKLITVYGNDNNGDLFQAEAQNNELDLSDALRVERPTATYVYLNDVDGRRIAGVDDMQINELLTPQVMEKRLPKINAAKVVVVDSNLPAETLNYIYENVTVPIFAKAVGINKAQNLFSAKTKIDTLVINSVEAKLLTQIEITGEKQAQMVADKLQAWGCKRVCIYADGLGIYYQTPTVAKFVAYHKANLVNTNGVGAAIIAASVYAKLQAKDLGETLKLMQRADVLTAQVNEAVTPKLSEIIEE